MKIDELKNLFKEFGDCVKFDYDLKKKNWFNIGGKSKVFYKANNLQELIKFLKILNLRERISDHHLEAEMHNFMLKVIIKQT